MAVDDLVGGSRLAADVIARNLANLGGPDLALSASGSAWIRDVCSLITRWRPFADSSSVRGRKVGVIISPPLASAQTAITACIGRNIEALAEGDGHRVEFAQCFGTSGSALSGNSVRSRSSWPILLQEGLMALDADHQRQARGADVRGMREHFGHGQHAMRGVEIVNGEPPVTQGCRALDMRAAASTLPDSSAMASESALKVEPIS